MAKTKKPLEILRTLEQSNCRECGEATCLAFASAVYRGQREIKECPRLDRLVIESLSENIGKHSGVKVPGKIYLNRLKGEIKDIDFVSAAERTGGRLTGDRLVIKVFGKNFGVDAEGNLHTDIHVNPYLAIPFLNYVIYGRGIEPSGKWISYRELKDGLEGYAIFHKRCETLIKQLADTHSDLIDDIVRVFNGQEVEKQFKSDISVVLHPLPKVPLMICYWRPEEGLESNLNVFFDKSANHNLDTDSLFNLAVGLAEMLKKLVSTHGLADIKRSSN